MGRDTVLFASAIAGESDVEVMAADYRLNIADDETKVQAAFSRDDDIEFHELIANAEGIEDDNCTILHSESMMGNAERVRIIVRAYADKNILVKLDSNKETALHVAADYGNTEVVEVLIDAARRLFSSSANDDPDNQITCFEDFIRHPNDSMNTALHLAVRNGDMAIAKLLVEADPNDRHFQSKEDFIRHPNDSMNTALHLAVSNGQMAIAKLLVEADPNDRHVQNSNGESPVYLAAKLGDEEIVKLICEACTAPGLAGPDGTTALHAAIMMLTEGKDEGLSVVKAIIEGAKKSASSSNRSYSSVRSFLRQCNKKDKDTALHLAVQRNHLAVAQYILEVDPSLLIVNKQSDFKSTIYKAAEQGYKDMVALLCDKYEDHNNHVHRGQTALCAAIIGRDTESVISILQRANHPVNYVDDKGWTLLHYAAFYKFDSVLEMIVEAQASVESEVLYKKKIPTPICIAAKEGHVSTVILLMVLLPNSWIVANSEGQNILHLAAVQKNKNMVLGILEYCPQTYIEKILNGKDVNGNTPMHLLICHGCYIPELMHNSKWPVDMMIRNNKNWTPADMLYLEEEIIGDQLRIKRAIDYMQTTRPRIRKSMIRSSKSENLMPLRPMESSSTSLVPLSKRSRKDVEFDVAKKRLIIREASKRPEEKDSTQIVITALITTITFTVGFTMPGGLYQNGDPSQGLTISSDKQAFQLFMTSDTIALVLSSCCLYLYFLQSIYTDSPLQPKLAVATTMLNLLSVIAMMITFISGTYVVLSHSVALANRVIIISSFFFIFFITLTIKLAYDGNVTDTSSVTYGQPHQQPALTKQLA